jgi:hypothetical protein
MRDSSETTLNWCIGGGVVLGAFLLFVPEGAWQATTGLLICAMTGLITAGYRREHERKEVTYPTPPAAAEQHDAPSPWEIRLAELERLERRIRKMGRARSEKMNALE